MTVSDDVIHVLHVDDDEAFVDMAATFLEREDDRIDVRTATSADEAESVVARDDGVIDCIVSDHDMPGRTGVELLEAVRTDRPDLPFVLYTGKGSEAVASDAISAGVTDYLHKKGGTEQYTVLANRITNAVEAYRSQRALTERNRELRQYERMINSMEEAACIYDADGRYVVVNEYLANWYGETRATLEGQSSNLIPLIEPQSDVVDPYEALFDGRRDRLDGEVESEFPGHGHAIIEYRLTPLAVNGDVEGVVGVARDITDRKERERELERRTEELESLAAEFEAQYRNLFEEAPVMAVVTRAEDGEPIVEDCNQLFVETLGHEKSDVIGRHLGEFYTPDSRRAMAEGGYERALEGRFMREDRDLVTADGDVVASLLRAVPRYDAGDEATGTLALYVDISTRRDLERQKSQLEEFTSVVSHDLRNPLNVARNRAELAREECDSEHLEAVSRAHERMSALIENLLSLARSGTDVGETEAVGLAPLAKRCWRTVATGETSLTVAIDRPIRADRERLRQLLENLMRNSVEHGSTGGRPGADDSVEHGQAVDDGDPITVTVGPLPDGFYVEDDGVGIPDAERDSVFEVGYSTDAEGTGFGLSIVERIVEVHGWTVRVTDGTDGGARFEFTGVGVVED